MLTKNMRGGQNLPPPFPVRVLKEHGAPVPPPVPPPMKSHTYAKSNGVAIVDIRPVDPEL